MKQWSVEQAVHLYPLCVSTGTGLLENDPAEDMRLLEEGPKSLSQSMGLDPELCLYSGIHLDIRLQIPSPELGSPRRGGVCKLGSSYAGSGSRISILDKKFSEAFRRFHLLASAT